jgi:hypothetical protein
MKRIILFIIILTGLYSFAQDSIKKIRFSGLSFDIGQFGTSDKGNLTLDDYKKISPDDELLNTSLTSYSSSAFFGEPQGFNNFFAPCVKAYFDYKLFKRVNTELFIGIKYRSHIFSGFRFYNTEEVFTPFVNYQNTKAYNEIIKTTDQYSFGLVGKQIFIPVGLNITTKKSRRFWFTAGLELAPGLSFAYQYRSMYWVDKSVSLLDASKIQNQNYNYQSGYTVNSEQNIYSQRIENINKLGFAFYAGVPLSVNLRLSKHVKILKNINANASISPGCYYSTSKTVTTNFAYAIAANLGLRVNW